MPLTANFIYHIQGYSETNCLQLSVLPSQLYYNRLAISGTPIVIARREIFDIRTQLMAEDNEGHDNAELISGLEEGDLKPNFYEEGSKHGNVHSTWQNWSAVKIQLFNSQVHREMLISSKFVHLPALINRPPLSLLLTADQITRLLTIYPCSAGRRYCSPITGSFRLCIEPNTDCGKCVCNKENSFHIRGL